MATPTFTVPPAQLSELKQAAAFINRANEVANHEQVIAYYCVYHGLKLALKLPRNKDITAYLGQLMDELEQFKTSIPNKEAITNDLVGQSIVEEFALKVFAKADNEDRATTPTKKTAVTFLAASIFMEVLRVFSAEGGELDDEIEEKIKYAKWKAADIMKALREGKVPISGPPGGSNDADGSGQTNVAGDQDMVTSPNTISQQPSVPPPKSPTVVQNIQPPAPVPQPAVFQPVQTSAPGVFLDPALSEQAQKFCRYAISSLQYDDVNSALDNLEKAAALLRPFKK